jgi:GT2 family glycosyltransferase
VPEQDTLSVVVCTRNRLAALTRCLQAVRAQTIPPNEIIVVDSAPDAGYEAAEAAAAFGALIHFEPEPGLSRARNRGARLARSAIVAYLDDDCVPDPRWIENLLPEFVNPSVAAVTGRIENFAESSNMGPCCAADIGDSRRPIRREISADTIAWFELANFGGMGDGGNMAIRKAIFQCWPGFDERLGRGALLGAGEEHFAFFQFISRGHHIVYQPAAIVRHPIPATCEEAQQRALSELRSTFAYLALLWSEAPAHRVDLVRFFLARFPSLMFRPVETWQQEQPARHSVPLSKWPGAFLSGVRAYREVARAAARNPRTIRQLVTHHDEHAKAGAD